MKMLEERITDDLTDNDDNSEEEEEEEEGGEEVQFDWLPAWMDAAITKWMQLTSESANTLPKIRVAFIVTTQRTGYKVSRLNSDN